MNRENKKRSYEKNYFKTHPCTEPFTCKVCGWQVTPFGAGSDHRNHCPNCLSSKHLDNEPGDRSADCGGIMEAIAVWVRKTGNGRSFTAAKYAARCRRTVSRRTTTPLS